MAVRGAGPGGPDTDTVVAARGGDPRALDTLVARCLPLVYNIVGRALHGHADVDDVVQETLLRVVRHLPELREPEAFRSWLVAIAVRQVRDRELDRRRALHRRADLDDGPEPADPASDFASVAILRLGLTDQRREVAEATRWLDGDDRALLSLWWLEVTGELDRAGLAQALGLTGAHAAVRVQRMKEQLGTARAVVRALRADPGCPGLAEAGRGWDGTPTPLWRKRLARHVRDCRHCAGRANGMLPADRLLAGLPLVPVPPALVAHAGGAAGHVAGVTKAAAARHVVRLRHLGRLRHLLTAAGHGPVAGVAAAAGTAMVVGTAVVAVHLTGSGTTAAAAPSSPTVAASASAAPSPSPSPTPSLPPSVGPTPTRPPAAPPPVVTTAKKGVSVWSFNGVNDALAQSGASWYYTWSTTHSGISAPGGVGFVPMIWGPGSVTAQALAQAKAAGPYLLGFNEPDLSSQSNMSVDSALNLWPQLLSTGRTLGSPAVATGGATAGGWLDRFMSGAASHGYRVDFVALHWYGSDFVTANAVGQLRTYLQSVYDRYHKPIWLTEFALIRFSAGGSTYPTQEQQAAFVTAAAKMLGGVSFVQRWAWFALPAPDTGDSTGLFRSGPQVTAVGRAFEAAG
jgi:RNA polymerase sigma factor (sigma-70 family)